jgi:hypothetical protein
MSGMYSAKGNILDPPRESSVIESILAVKLDHEPLLEVVGSLAHDLGVAVLEDVRAADLDVALSGRWAQGGLRAEVDELASEIALVLGDVLVERRRKAGIVPGGRLGAEDMWRQGESSRRRHGTYLWSTK